MRHSPGIDETAVFRGDLREKGRLRPASGFFSCSATDEVSESPTEVSILGDVRRPRFSPASPLKRCSQGYAQFVVFLDLGCGIAQEPDSTAVHLPAVAFQRRGAARRADPLEVTRT